MKMLRGGMIGCGFFARNHLHAWAEVPGVEIAALCDADPSRADAYGREFGVPHIYGDAEAMFRSEHLDFVDVVTQPETHRPLVERAARNRASVICQKPMAPSLEEARSMVRACAGAGVPFMLHENFRWQAPMRALKAASAELGPLFFGRIVWRTPYDVYRDQPYLARDPRFIIADVGVHLLDLARFFLGEVESLFCVTRRVNPHIRGEDTATILLRMRSGAACVVELSYASRLEEDLFPQTLVHLEGAAGVATLGPHFTLTVTRGGETRQLNVKPEVYPWSAPGREAIQDSVVRIQRHWAECLRSGAQPETSGADNLRTLELVYGAYDSAERGEAWKAKPSA